jgi:ribosomal protein S27AE
MLVYFEDELEIIDNKEYCPKCGKDFALMDIE